MDPKDQPPQYGQQAQPPQQGYNQPMQPMFQPVHHTVSSRWSIFYSSL